MKLHIAILLFLGFSLGAQELPSRLHWVGKDTGAFNVLTALYTSQGLSPPSSSGPFTGAELSFYLSKIDRTTLTPALSKSLTWLESLAAPEASYREGDLFAVDSSLEASLETYLGAGDPENRIWDRGWGDRPAMLDWDNKFWLSKYGFMQFHIDARQDPIAVMDLRGPVASNAFYNLDQLDGFFPTEGYLSMGVPHLELKWGHYPLSWGQGQNGNLLISDAAGVHDFVEASTWWDWFKFQVLYMDMDSYTLRHDPTRISSTSALVSGVGSDEVLLPGLAETNLFGYPTIADVAVGDSAMDVSRRLVSHRFEFRLPGNWNLHITEANMFTATSFELRHLMPMFIYHNWFQQWNANPNFTIEAEWTPTPGFMFYATMLGDYVTTPFKEDWYADPHPPAMGYQLGLKTSHALDEGIFSTVVEGVYVNPYVYLDQAVDWVVMRRVLTNYQAFLGQNPRQRQAMIIDSPLGFYLGPDSATALIRAAYTVPGAWEASFEAEGRLKGEVTLRSLHPLLTNSTTYDPTSLLDDQDPGVWAPSGDTIMRALIIRLGAELNPSVFIPSLPKGLGLNQLLSLAWVENGLDPFKERDPLKPSAGNNYFDIQWALGLSWKF